MKNKIKKIIPYLFLLIALVGVFGYGKEIKAQAGNLTTQINQCLAGIKGKTSAEILACLSSVEKNMCKPADGPAPYASCVSLIKQAEDSVIAGAFKPTDTTAAGATAGAQTSTGTYSFEHAVSEQTCVSLTEFSMSACILKFTYVVFYQLGGWLLGIAAVLFNFLISYTLDSSFLRSDFISHAWGVVRDISNMFFILILLYIGIKVLLNMGGHETKSMISSVIIMAILINFSMFFTQIVIDSSNIVALIFYNKTSSIDKDGKAVIDSISGKPDLAGGLTQSFNPAYKLDADFFTAGVTDSMLIGITLISGGIMLFAAYALFVSGFSFLGRLIELFVLIIFAPFAFMSYVIPALSHAKYVGWGSWSERLISVAFMAPIFMFFLYFIFLLLGKDMFTNAITTEGTLATLLNLIIPAAVVLTLLLKATEFAKKGSGQFGEAVMNGAKVAGGLAIGGAALGGAGLLRGTGGATAKYVQNKGAREKDLKIGDRLGDNFKGWNKINPAAWARSAGIASKFATAGLAESLHKTPAPFNRAGKTIGQVMKDSDEGLNHKAHATHILDAKMQSEYGHEYGKEGKYKDLSEGEQEIVKGEIEKDEMAKFIYGKLFKDLGAPQAKEVKDLHTAGNRAIDDGHGKTIGYGTALDDVRDSGGAQKVDAAGNAIIGEKFKSDYFVDASGTSAALGEFVQALRKGSFDIRNLPDVKPKSKGAPAATLKTVAAVAAGIRLGLKKSGTNYGTSQKDVLKDIGNTISDSLKNAKFSISGGHDGGHGKDDHSHEVKSVGH